MASKFEELTRYLATSGGMALPPGLLAPIAPVPPQVFPTQQVVLGTPVSMIPKSFWFSCLIMSNTCNLVSFVHPFSVGSNQQAPSGEQVLQSPVTQMPPFPPFPPHQQSPQAL
jgi:hypothetical protein